MGAGVFDIRSLTERAFRTQLQSFATSISASLTANTFISSDTEELQHPGVRIMAVDPTEEISPGTGIYRMRVSVDTVFKADEDNADTTAAFVLAVRQAYYRNDLDARPMQNLAKQLTAQNIGLTVMGVVPIAEGPVQVDGAGREYTYRLLFDVHATPLQ
jgi:hypothetical protein